MATILVVEDNADLLAILEQLLGQEYEVMTAMTGERALRLAAAHRPDLVILDLQLPDMSGVDIGMRLKQQYGGDVPILVLTALADQGDPEAVLASGCCDAYLAKPAPLSAIQAEVAELLERSGHMA